MGFLAHIANSISEESLPYLYKRCFIFPTQRAGYNFQQLLKKRFSDRSFIYPEIITIQNFIRRYADDAVVDEFTLLTEIYPLHEALTNTQQSFDKFIPWGQQILKDFDEIDKYLVDAEKLFSAVFSQKQLEEDFDLGDETKQYLRDFLNTIDEAKAGEFQQEFLKTWKVLGDLYPLFQQALREKRICYEGMAYREMIEKLQSNNLSLPFEQIHFCGFNAFSNSEEKLVQLLSEQHHTETWWDADVDFMENVHHEAGNFLRRYKTLFSGEKHHWITDAVPMAEKNISITGIASHIGQVEYVAGKTIPENTGQTCIVLCDEGLLLPLLNYLPTQDINITMGFPVVHSGAYMILNRMLQLYRNSKASPNSTVFYYKDIMGVVDDPYLSGLFRDIPGLKQQIGFSVPYVSLSILEKYFKESWLPDIFQSGLTAAEVLQKIMHVLLHMTSTDNYFILPKNEVITTLHALQQRILESDLDISIAGLCRIVPAQFTAKRIPFDSNRESSIQIMGFLETRLQDFENVSILSLNDDILPGTNRTNTFIPYNIRRSFGMPTFEQFDGINAYHFYRLLKRAKNIDLIYNNALSDNASEKSRFIRQIEYEWNNRVHTQQLHANALLTHRIPDTINIPKTGEMKTYLRTVAFSPSSLKLYLNCPVQFYLKYIAKIEEPDELQADPDAATFGNVLHNAMELFYRPFVDQKITGDIISKALQEKSFLTYLDEGSEKAGISKNLFHGKNKLQWRILERIGTSILTLDSHDPEFKLIGTETELIYEKIQLNDGSFATIKGKIDRIDKTASGITRIIDYKTGKVELARFPKDDSEKELGDFFKKIFHQTTTDHSVSFQGMMYALLYKKINPTEEVSIGFYKATDLGSGIHYLNGGNPIPASLLAIFEKKLGELLSEIIYEKDSFDMSDKEDAYAYSPYAELLGFH